MPHIELRERERNRRMLATAAGVSIALFLLSVIVLFVRTDVCVVRSTKVIKTKDEAALSSIPQC